MQRPSASITGKQSPRPHSPATKTGTRTDKVSRRRQSKLATVYLVLYNLLSAIAWSYFVYRFISAWSVNWKSSENAFTSTIFLLCTIQSVAILEILHAAVGLTPSPVLPTIMQIASRLFVAWMMGYWLRAGETSWGYHLIATAWSLSDITRYLYYTINLVGRPPSWLVWLRYTLFLVLYPMGVVGEIMLIRNGTLVLGGFRNINPHFRHALMGVMAIYPFGFLFMYFHMLKQRAKYVAII